MGVFTRFGSTGLKMKRMLKRWPKSSGCAAIHWNSRAVWMGGNPGCEPEGLADAEAQGEGQGVAAFGPPVHQDVRGHLDLPGPRQHARSGLERVFICILKATSVFNSVTLVF